MISFSRIDDRLIHGQVATTWVRISGTNRIYIVDDQTSKDDFMSNLYKNLAPQGTKVNIWDVDEAKEKLQLVAEHPQIKGFVLCKGPHTFLELAKSGIKFDNLVVGNMAPKDGRTQLVDKANTWADTEEKECFKGLVNMGVNVYIQHIPDNPKIPILEAKGMK